VRGAADRVPEALAAIGVPVEVLGERVLGSGDLSVYDAIVIGSRAYETDPALPRANGRLLDYARAGGRLIVQYQQYPFVQGGYAPFPLEIARPHDRVTDETAKVTVLQPGLPVFHSPNEIGDADWQGWVQERGSTSRTRGDPSSLRCSRWPIPAAPSRRARSSRRSSARGATCTRGSRSSVSCRPACRGRTGCS
jgi:hypothetical protein